MNEPNPGADSTIPLPAESAGGVAISHAASDPRALAHVHVSKRTTDLTGKRFGRFVVLGMEIGPHPHKWLCQCDCGTRKVVVGQSLRRGHSNSCGCAHKEWMSHKFTKHGKSNSQEWNSWRSMIVRCRNPKGPSARNYIERGIDVCARWKEGFNAFLADMGPRPKGHSIERIDNEKGYEPGNCVWATPTQQTINRRVTRFVEVDGERMPFAHATKLVGFPGSTIRRWMSDGRSFEEAIRALRAARS